MVSWFCENLRINSGGEKNPIEVRELLSGLLHSRGITDPNQCPLETFAKACSLRNGTIGDASPQEL